jgi:hypothetical protein
MGERDQLRAVTDTKLQLRAAHVGLDGGRAPSE